MSADAPKGHTIHACVCVHMHMVVHMHALITDVSLAP